MNLLKLNKQLSLIDPSLKAEVNIDNCLVLTGEVDDYKLSVKAAKLSLDKKKYLGLINDIKVRGKELYMKIPSFSDISLDNKEVDVLVIGGGIVGASILRELSKYKLNTLLVEKGHDLACAQSSRNGGVVHVGINFSTHSNKLKYCVRGNNMYEGLCKDLDVPFERKGQSTFARTYFEKFILRCVASTGKKKGIGLLKILSRDELRKIEPSVPDWAKGGLWMGTGGITCPHRMTFAMAENAVENGAYVSLNTAVTSMELKDNKIIKVLTNRGTIIPKVVVNAAGIFSDMIANMADDRTFSIHARTGTDIIFDKKVGWMAASSMGKTPFTLSPSQIASLTHKPFAFIKATINNLHSHSKGVGLIHSVDGNMLVGPNADEVYDRENHSTTKEVIDKIIEVQKEVQPLINKNDVIAYFTGLRAPTYEEDFVVRQGIRTKNIFEAAGIQSPGITAAPAIAEDMAIWIKDYLASTGVDVKINESFNPIRKSTPVLKELSDEDRNKLIKENPNYGEIVCRCEEVSKGEMLDCLHSVIPVHTIDSIKKRCRPGMGRCQGSFCMPLVAKIIADDLHINLEDVVYKTQDSKIAFGKTK